MTSVLPSLPTFPASQFLSSPLSVDFPRLNTLRTFATSSFISLNNCCINC